MLRIFILVLSLAVLTGCASTLKMPLQSDADHIQSTSRPIFLLTVTLKNSYRARWQPELKTVQVVREDGSKKEKVVSFEMDSEGTIDFDDDNIPKRYLVRLELDPGTYTIRGMTSTGRAFPIVATFFTPLHSSLVASKGGVFYLGSITATIRERQGNEFKAGPAIPLIDQAIAGASTGTFEVEIADNFEADKALFKKTFPALQNNEITKSILPPFDRAKAQQWWDAN